MSFLQTRTRSAKRRLTGQANESNESDPAASASPYSSIPNTSPKCTTSEGTQHFGNPQTVLENGVRFAVPSLPSSEPHSLIREVIPKNKKFKVYDEYDVRSHLVTEPAEKEKIAPNFATETSPSKGANLDLQRHTTLFWGQQDSSINPSPRSTDHKPSQTELAQEVSQFESVWDILHQPSSIIQSNFRTSPSNRTRSKTRKTKLSLSKIREAPLIEQSQTSNPVLPSNSPVEQQRQLASSFHPVTAIPSTTASNSSPSSNKTSNSNDASSNSDFSFLIQQLSTFPQKNNKTPETEYEEDFDYGDSYDEWESERVMSANQDISSPAAPPAFRQISAALPQHKNNLVATTIKFDSHDVDSLDESELDRLEKSAILMRQNSFNKKTFPASSVVCQQRKEATSRDETMLDTPVTEICSILERVDSLPGLEKKTDPMTLSQSSQSSKSALDDALAYLENVPADEFSSFSLPPQPPSGPSAESGFNGYNDNNRLMRNTIDDVQHGPASTSQFQIFHEADGERLDQFTLIAETSLRPNQNNNQIGVPTIDQDWLTSIDFDAYDSICDFDFEDIENIGIFPKEIEEQEENVLTTSRYRRFCVLDYDELSGKVRCLDEASGIESFILLQDSWKSMVQLHTGDRFNIVGKAEISGSDFLFIVDDSKNLLILHPHILISGSSLSSSSECMRRSVISHMMKVRPLPPDLGLQKGFPLPTSDQTDSSLALVGIMGHELFQNSIEKMDFSKNTVMKAKDDILKRKAAELFWNQKHISTMQASKVLEEHCTSIMNWSSRFINPSALSQNNKEKSSSSNNIVEMDGEMYRLQVEKFVDSEEHVTSLMYGLKGDIDVTLLVNLTPVNGGSSSSPKKLKSRPITRRFFLPLEIKSRSLHPSHCFQAVLYSLLMADRYNKDIPVALLFSLNQPQTVAIPIDRRKVMRIIQQRNQLAYHLKNSSSLPILPAPLSYEESSNCKNCYQLQNCMATRKLLLSSDEVKKDTLLSNMSNTNNNQSSTTDSSDRSQKTGSNIDDPFKRHPLESAFKLTTSFINPSHIKFFNHWMNLIDLEAKEISTFREEIWSLQQEEREAQGRCLGGMRLVKVSYFPPSSLSSTYTSLVQKEEPVSSTPAFLKSPDSNRFAPPSPNPTQPSSKKRKRKLSLNHSTHHSLYSYSQASQSPEKSNEEIQPSQMLPTGKHQIYLTFERWKRYNSTSRRRIGAMFGRTDSAAVDNSPPKTPPTIPPKQRWPASGSPFQYSTVQDTPLPDHFINEIRGRPLIDLQFEIGDKVMLSEGRHPGLLSGSIVALTPSSIVVACNRSYVRVPPRDIPAEVVATNQTFSPITSKFKPRISQTIESSTISPTSSSRNVLILDIEDIGSSCIPTANQNGGNAFPEFEHRSAMGVRWKIDKDLVQSGFNTWRGNVLQLFHKNEWADLMRSLIVDLDPPEFILGSTSPSSTSSSPFYSQKNDNLLSGYDKYIVQQFNLNRDQQAAVKKTLSSKNYSLILGMPGTGKSKTTIAIILMLLKRGKTILLTASTHSAVDGLLLTLLDFQSNQKLQQEHFTSHNSAVFEEEQQSFEFFRLGQPQMVHPRLREFTLFDSPNLKDVKDFESLLGPNGKRFQLVAATCAGVHHPMLYSRMFDYCIIDESSQITLPMCLGPISFAFKFILIGDMYQLPPIVQNLEAQTGGLSESLFKILAEKHPQAVSKLTIQYRMNDEISSLANELVYQGLLVTGSDEISNQVMDFPSIQRFEAISQNLVSESNAISSSIDRHSEHMLHQDFRWLCELLQPSRMVSFLNTDAVPAPEELMDQQDTAKNSVESIIVSMICKTLIHLGIAEEQIGIISPQRNQLKTIKFALSNIGIDNHIDVHTVDKYQGRDKDCIIVSLVRSNSVKNVGKLLRDWKRLNVAITRAKRKLIFIGSKSTLNSSPFFSIMFSMITKNNWEIKLPKDAHLMMDSLVSIMEKDSSKMDTDQSENSMDFNQL